MKIECLARREGGTAIDMGSAVYHFLPDEHGRHVAEVTDPQHIANFASIPEGYRFLDQEAPAPVPKPTKKSAGELPAFPKGRKK